MKRLCYLIALLLPALLSCSEEKPPEAPPPVRAEKAAEPAPSQTPERCNERPAQVGPGCDMEGIQAVVRRELRPSGGIARCYRNNSPNRDRGRLEMRIVLGPDGGAVDVAPSKDELNNPALTTCIRSRLLRLRYPAPGDIHCTALYPFIFK